MILPAVVAASPLAVEEAALLPMNSSNIIENNRTIVIVLDKLNDIVGDIVVSEEALGESAVGQGIILSGYNRFKESIPVRSTRFFVLLLYISKALIFSALSR